MNKKFDNAYLNQCTDNAIKRGYEIYDEWIQKKYNSRKIVASAHGAVTLFKKRKNMAAFIEALAYIFAIDTHIKEKYNNILRCLFSYFSWRRETRALDTLKTELNIPLGATDIRNLIAVEIEKLAQKLEDGWEEDGDDETHGGKRNGKAEDEAAAEEKEIEESAEEKSETEELENKEEAEKDLEEKEELPNEEAQQEEAKEEVSEKEIPAESQQEEAEKTVTDEKVEFTQEKNEHSKEENNVPDFESEPNTDKKEEAKSYNDAVDSPPLYEEAASEHSAEKASLIDEMIMDSFLKGDRNIIGYQRIDEAEHINEADIPRDKEANQNEKNEGTDKDAYLYDKVIATDKGEAQQTLNEETANKDGRIPETKTEQSEEKVQIDENINYTKQEFKPSGEMLQSYNLNENLDNDIASALNDNMSLESKMAIIRMKEEQLREHISITLEELGMNDTSDVLRVSEPDAVRPPSTLQNRK